MSKLVELNLDTLVLDPHGAHVIGRIVVGVIDRGLKSLHVGQGVGLNDLLHVGLRVHENEGELGRQLSADRAEKELDLEKSKIIGNVDLYLVLIFFLPWPCRR